MPAWAAVVAAVSLAILATSALVIMTTHVVAARRLAKFLAVFERAAGPAVDDVRQLVGVIRGEAESLVGTSRDIRLRIVAAADAAEARLVDLDALLDVVQDEVQETALDVAAALKRVRRGVTVGRLAGRLLRRSRRRKR